jgi:acetyl-CoA acetyltransferase
MPSRTYVIGVGMTKFEKPGARDWGYQDMGREAGERALLDAGVPYDAVQAAFAGWVYGDSTSGQRAIYGLGMTGIPVVNVNNNCSTGSSALYLANRFVQGGLADCALAVGFEKMERGSLTVKFPDRTFPMDLHFEDMRARRGIAPGPGAPQLFGNAAIEYQERYGLSDRALAKIAVKNHRHSVNNPYAQFQVEYSLDDVLSSPQVFGPLTKLQCCPTSDGGAAAVVASERFVHERGLEHQAVEIVGQAMTTDLTSTFSGSDLSIAGFDMTRSAAREVYEQSGLGPEDVQVIELHDCFSANELITYDALELCAPGQAGSLIEEDATTYGGKWVVNPSGGLISKGHPLGATGLAQCSELVWQLRGQAQGRQVPGATVALQHNIGLGGAAVVTMYRKAA